MGNDDLRLRPAPSGGTVQALAQGEKPAASGDAAGDGCVSIRLWLKPRHPSLKETILAKYNDCFTTRISEPVSQRVGFNAKCCLRSRGELHVYPR
jgi:hypothetical protein